MSIHLYLTFVLACILLAIAPGPNMSLFLANGATHGTKAALTTICGGTLGLAILVAAAALGMGSVMAVMADWFDVIRWVGAAYLVWLGYVRLRSAFSDATPEETATPRPDRWFWQGTAVSLSNPKVLLFLGAFFPQFIEPTAPVAPQLAILAVTFVITMASVDTSIALAFGSARDWLVAKGRRMTDGISGVLLLCGGLWLAAIRR